MDKLAPQKVTYPYIEKMYGMHGIRIAPLTVSVKGKEVTLPRWLSGNGDSIRLFPTKKQTEDVRYIKAGKLKAYKIGKEYRIDKTEFTNFLNSISTK